MKQYKVLMTEPAVDDLQAIVKYISDELLEPVIAKKLVGKIKEAVMGLEKLPTRHALVADERLAAQGIRKLIVENYIAFYVISEVDEIVTVIRILYGRRDWEHWL
ncbi:type II toxin-antitoxin system RelE/ParE family toxin [Candidatus Contubernalis alkaliaceticus]|uniref:type II toxin-antitoxin system RelE/ParE family toxin n=1 Tax=Candidatus Contubernalis alkaliaceticus TaxID=338645 RepID=UPI001F4C3BEA|nr:type II toxin-antitoxin system RelE/ParE family toxin [Candidatus Contubernalis alkalaceticus]UNC91734.1 type II toxin-antitoxin system RelE/ParE family toxin [Candidatus Contubernalis alkalaceticus]